MNDQIILVSRTRISFEDDFGGCMTAEQDLVWDVASEEEGDMIAAFLVRAGGYVPSVRPLRMMQNHKVLRRYTEAEG